MGQVVSGLMPRGQLEVPSHNTGTHYSLSLICQPDIRGHEAPRHHHRDTEKYIHGPVSCLMLLSLVV